MSGREPVAEVADGVYCVGVGRGVLASNVYLIRSGASPCSLVVNKCVTF